MFLTTLCLDIKMSKTTYRKLYDIAYANRPSEREVLKQTRLRLRDTIETSRVDFPSQITEVIFEGPYAEHMLEMNTMLNLTTEEAFNNLQSAVKTNRMPIDQVDIYKDYWEVLWGTGMRASDVSHLKVKDLDFDNEFILGNSQKSNTKGLTRMNRFIRPVLEKIVQGKGPDDLLFTNIEGNPIATADAGNFWYNLARGTKGIDANNFKRTKDAPDFGFDILDENTRTARKAVVNLTASLYDVFEGDRLDYTKGLEAALLHADAQSKAYYRQTSDSHRIRAAEGRAIRPATYSITPRDRAILDVMWDNSLRIGGAELIVNDLQGLRHTVRTMNRTENPEPKIKKAAKEVQERISEYNQVIENSRKSFSPRKIQRTIMPANMSVDEQVDFIKQQNLSAGEFKAPATDPDPRFAEGTDPKKVKRYGISSPIRLRQEQAKDVNIVEEFLKENSEYLAKHNITLDDAIPQITDKFHANESFLRSGKYFNDMNDQLEDIIQQIGDAEVDVDDIFNDIGNTYDEAGDAKLFFGKENFVEAPDGALKLKVPKNLMWDFLGEAEYRSRLFHLAQNMVEAAEHTMLPDKYASATGIRDHIIRKIKLGNLAWLKQNPDEELGLAFKFGGDNMDSGKNYQKISNDDFITDLNEIIEDLGSLDQKEYTTVKDSYYDDFVEKNKEGFYTDLDEKKLSNWITNDPKLSRTIIKSVIFEPFHRLLNEVQVEDGEGFFNRYTYDKEGLYLNADVYDTPLSQRLEWKKNGIHPALRDKDHYETPRTNISRKIFNSVVPEPNIQVVDDSAYSLGPIEYLDDRGSPIQDVKLPSAREITEEAIESLDDTILRRAARGVGTIAKYGAYVIPLYGTPLKAGPIAFEFFIEGAMAGYFANMDKIGKGLTGERLFDTNTSVEGFTPSADPSVVRDQLETMEGKDIATLLTETDAPEEPVSGLEMYKEKGRDLLRSLAGVGGRLIDAESMKAGMDANFYEGVAKEADQQEMEGPAETLVTDTTGQEIQDYYDRKTETLERRQNDFARLLEQYPGAKGDPDKQIRDRKLEQIDAALLEQGDESLTQMNDLLTNNQEGEDNAVIR
mgnify:CR=1 FL=1